MIYDCLLHTANQKFVVAKSAGWAWTDSERAAPFEIVTVDLPDTAEVFDPVDLIASWGTLFIEAQDIEPVLIATRVMHDQGYEFTVADKVFTSLDKALQAWERVGNDPALFAATVKAK